VADAEPAAGERVQSGDVGGAVVGQQALDRDPLPAVEGDGAVEEADRRPCLLVGQYLGVGETAVVVDRHVHVLPADRLALDAGGVEPSAVRVALDASGHALAGAALDPAQLLDVEMDELARARALVAKRLLEPEPAQAAEPRAG